MQYALKRFKKLEVHHRMAFKRHELRNNDTRAQYLLGVAAFKRGQSILENPHRGFMHRNETPDAWDAWKLGWNEARVGIAK